MFIREYLATSNIQENSDISDACDDAMCLLGHAFASITAKRREDILKFTDPRFESLLKGADRADRHEGDGLFGRSFLRSMVNDADDDAKLRSMSRPSNSSYRQDTRSSNNRGRGGGHSSNYNSSSSSGFNKRGSNNFHGKGYVDDFKLCSAITRLGEE